MQLVDDEAALAVVVDQPRLAEHAEVVRHLNDVAAQELSKLADVLRPLAKALDDAQPLGLGEDAEDAGAVLRLEVLHGSTAPGKRVRKGLLGGTASGRSRPRPPTPP